METGPPRTGLDVIIEGTDIIMYPNSTRSYAQAAARPKPAAPARVQTNSQSQIDDEPDTYIVREDAPEHSYTGTAFQTRHERTSPDLRGRSMYPQTDAGMDSVQDDSILLNDPYYQQYIDTMELNKTLKSEAKRKSKTKRGGKPILPLEYNVSTDGDTQAVSGVQSPAADTVSRSKSPYPGYSAHHGLSKAVVGGVHRVQDVENSSGVTAGQQGATNSRDIQFGWDDEVDEPDLPQSGMPHSGTVGQPPYVQGIEPGTAQLGDIGTFENQGCICESLMYELQNWCCQKHRQGPTEVTTTVSYLLDHLRKSCQISHGVPVCSEHGFPDISAQSQCDQCADEFEFVDSFLADQAGAAHQTPQSLQPTNQMPANQAPANQVPFDRESRKEISEANTALTGIIKAIECSVREAEEEDRQLGDTLRLMNAKREEAERALGSQVQRLYTSISHQHQVALENLNRAHGDCVTQVETDKQRVKGFAGDLTGLHRDMEQKLAEIETGSVSAAREVPHLQQQFYDFMGRKPQTVAKVRPRYNHEVKSVTNEEIASMVGDIKITVDDSPETTSAPSPPPGFGGRPKVEFPSNFAASSAGQTDISFLQPSMEDVDPYLPYMDGGASTASLGQNGKAPHFMASTSSLASEASYASSTRSSLQNQQKTAKTKAETLKTSSAAQNVRPDIQKMRPKVQDARPTGVQDQASAPSAQPASESITRMQPTMRTITVKPNCSPHILRLSGPAPVAIAPTDDGLVWMVYAVRNPNLHLMSGTKKFLETIRIGGNAVAVAVLKSNQILLACHSPSVHLRLVKDGVPQHVMDLPATPVSVSVGKSGVVVGGYTTLCWVTLPGWKAHWIVPEKDSPLKKVCSTAVTFLQGKELVCAADKVGEAVHFYLKSDAKTFTPLRPYYGPPQSANVETNGQFVPISVTAHRQGFVAVLDAVSLSVYVLNVERQSQQAVSVIPGQSLFRSAIPSVIAFGSYGFGDGLKLWAVARPEDDAPFVSHTPLTIQ